LSVRDGDLTLDAHLAVPAESIRVGFLLVPDFAMLSYAAAVEPLRAANRLAGAELYVWRHIGLDRNPVRASNGLAIVPDGAVGEEAAVDRLFVCAGGNPAGIDHAGASGWLRALARRGVTVGAISGGPFLLARAGLLEGRRATVHWEHMPAFVEAFPGVEATGRLFEADGDRITCAGGLGAFDLMLELIARDHGARLAAAVGDWFLMPGRRSGSAVQRRDAGARHAVADPRLARALARMEATVAAPLDRADLARAAGIGLRRLEALFRAELGTSIARHQITLRLDRARRLLRQSALPVTEVSAACGFESPAHFARRYRDRFGRAPSRDRRGDLTG
jgi:transcriptional regulator GlxA family with amidase domain